MRRWFRLRPPLTLGTAISSLPCGEGKGVRVARAFVGSRRSVPSVFRPSPLTPFHKGEGNAAAILIMALTLAGCDQSMTQQKKYDAYARADIWADGTSARPLPAGTVARGDAARAAALAERPPLTMALLRRGQERYDIYCSPCHGLAGMGDGMIVQRGFPPPPSFESPRLRAASAEHVVDVITNGYGVMYSYAARVEPEDRWAIAAYVRALQAAGGVPVAVVPDAGDKLR